MKRQCLILLLILTFVSSASATTVEMIPNHVELEQGTQFIININVTPTQDVDTIASDLITWNPEILECIKVEQGSIFENYLVWIPGEIDNINGNLTGVCGASNIITDEPGKWIVLTFKGKSAGKTDITIEHLGIARNGTDLLKTIGDPVNVKITGPVDIIKPVDNGTYEPENNSQNTKTGKTDIPFLLPFIGVIIIIIVVFWLYFANKRKRKPKSDDDDMFS